MEELHSDLKLELTFHHLSRLINSILSYFDPSFLSPEPTSYDYDAPISEAGDLTDKYFAFKKVIGKYLPIPDISVQDHVPKGS